MKKPRSLTALAAMALALGAAALIGAGSATARLSAADSFSFSSDHFSVNEAAGPAVITILRSGPTATTATVQFVTAKGTADLDLDYTLVSEYVPFAPGETSKTVYVPIVNDNIGEGNETIGLTLANPTGGPGLGSPNTATLTIIDDDIGFAFAYDNFNVVENDGTAYVTVRRLGVETGSDSVNFATGGGSANPGSDYTPVNQTVTFVPGQTSQNVPIAIADDTLVDGSRTIQLSLSNPSVGTSLSAPNVATVTILDNDRPPAPVAKPAGKVASARMTKTGLKSSEAGLVKVLYTLYPKSTRFAYVLSYKSDKSDSGWTTVRTVKKTGSFAGQHTMTVRQLFGPRSIGTGSYRLKLVADTNSKTIGFKVR